MVSTHLHLDLTAPQISDHPMHFDVLPPMGLDGGRKSGLVRRQSCKCVGLESTDSIADS